MPVNESTKAKVEVKGRSVDFADGRRVMLGRVEGKSDFAMRFISASGQETDVTLSEEVMGALVGLWQELVFGEDTQ
jgi:hypothetical protein